MRIQQAVRWLSVAAIALIAARSAMAQPYPYVVEDLGPQGSVGMGINENGDVAGFSLSHAFLWPQGGARVELPGLPGYTSAGAYSINDAGTIAGDSGIELTGAPPARAARWTSSSVLSLGTLGTGRFSHAKGINGSGHVAGWSETQPNSLVGVHAFLYTDAGGLQVQNPASAQIQSQLQIVS